MEEMQETQRTTYPSDKLMSQDPRTDIAKVMNPAEGSDPAKGIDPPEGSDSAKGLVGERRGDEGKELGEGEVGAEGIDGKGQVEEREGEQGVRKPTDASVDARPVGSHDDDGPREPESDEEPLPSEWPPKEPKKMKDLEVKAPSTERQNFYRKKHRTSLKKDPMLLVYPMRKRSRAFVLIVNNKNFDKEKEPRLGTDIDSAGLQKLFKDMGCEVVVKENLKAKKMKTCFDDYSSETKTYKNYDCFILCILSHGDKDCVLGTDRGRLSLQEDIVDKFSKVESLQGKPKLFFIQACQGDKKDLGHRATADLAPEDGRSDALPSNIIPSNSDVFIAMSTTPDNVAWRRPDFGSYFIQAIIEVFTSHAYKRDLHYMVTRANSLVSMAMIRGDQGQYYKQTMLKTDSFTKQLFFFPGLHDSEDECSSTDTFDGAGLARRKHVILVFGKTCDGASSTCNTILGEDKFTTCNRARRNKETAKCLSGSRLERYLTVVDAPGLLDAEEKDLQSKVKVAVELCPGGRVDVALLVIRYPCRFEEKEKMALEAAEKALQENGVCFERVGIIAFTHGEQFPNQDQFEQWLGEQEEDLKDVLDECSGRAVLFSNSPDPAHEEKKEASVRDLFKVIDEIPILEE